jgi:hypothetical protein
LSGSRESNPDHSFFEASTSPRLVGQFFQFPFRATSGEPGIEPGPLGPKPNTLPLCYTPSEKINKSLFLFEIRTRGESFRLHPDVAKNMKIERTDPKPNTLPLCYTPSEQINKSLFLFKLRTSDESFCLHPRKFELLQIFVPVVDVSETNQTRARAPKTKRSPQNIPLTNKKCECIVLLFPTIYNYSRHPFR